MSRQIHSETRHSFLQINGIEIFSDMSRNLYMLMTVDQRFAVTILRLSLYRIPYLPIIEDGTLGLCWMHGREIQKKDLAMVELFLKLRSLCVKIKGPFRNVNVEESQRLRDVLQETNGEKAGLRQRIW